MVKKRKKTPQRSNTNNTREIAAELEDLANDDVLSMDGLGDLEAVEELGHLEDHDGLIPPVIASQHIESIVEPQCIEPTAVPLNHGEPPVHVPRDLGWKQLPARRFNALFAGNRLPENNTPFEFTPPVDPVTLEYSEQDVHEGIKYWQFSLIGTLIGQKPIYRAMEHYAHTYWKVVPAISMTGWGICLFRLETEAHMLKVLHGDPWTVNGTFPLLLRQWKPSIKLDASSLQVLPVWFKLPDLDL